ncbi:MAG: hypothetical protein ACJ8M1_05600 [Chthoniobacterales bacterium]
MGFQIRNALILSIVVACAAAVQLAAPAPVPDPMNQAAEEYVKLALALGQHDPDYVDAYYGPAEWKSQAETNKRPLTAIADEAAKLRDRIGALTPSNDEMMRLRREYLTKQLGALAARVEIVRGKRMTFDDESRALYDAVAPTFPLDHYEKLLADIGATGALKPAGAFDGRSLSQRYDDWHNGFIVPKEKLDTVFQCAIKECRVRTLAHLSLPPNESFTVEYVTHKPWGGYNWYKGNYQSVIQINTDLPVYIERAVDLAAHEGYPGHHVYNTLLEKNLTRGRGWVEFSCLPLYAPQALVSEGTANFGRDVVFTKEERLQFEKKVLWPAAGLDPDKAEQYYAIQDLLKNLAYSRNEAARALLDGKIDAAAAQAWLEKYGLLSPGLAGKAVEFIEHYRSYVINYNYGEDLVRHYIEQQGGTADQPARRWKEFGSLLSSPRLPSGLQ